MSGSASWRGRVALAEADAKPGHYYVTVRKPDGRTALALGPFTQRRPGKEAHAQALGYVRRVRRFVQERNLGGPHTAWLTFGTSRIDIVGTPPVGRLNKELLP